tara:strand:- start:172 stop:609 length:438 start_codon:yes stop_codon:yes gene_type:complete
MKRIKPTDKNVSPNQRRLRLMELSGVPITDIQKKRILNESVSMVLPPLKHERDRVGNSMIWNGNDISDIEDEDEIDLDEILKEMGYYDEEDEDDLREDFESDDEEDETISNMSREELKTMIQNIVLDTMEEEDDLNEIIENITKT